MEGQPLAAPGKNNTLRIVIIIVVALLVLCCLLPCCLFGALTVMDPNMPSRILRDLQMIPPFMFGL